MRRDEQFSEFFGARAPALRRTAYLILRDWPFLVIPAPRTDDSGCQWTLPGSDITCAGQ